MSSNLLKVQQLVRVEPRHKLDSRLEHLPVGLESLSLKSQET